MVNTSTIITIFISCIGLFGLMLFTAEKRAKEISIRKILGAGVGALLIALITISFHAAKAALASPVENLRSE